MKIALIVVGVIVVAAIAFSAWSRITYRRWRRRFDSLSLDERSRREAGLAI